MQREEAQPGGRRGARRQAMRARILETADRLFYSRGIRAVGVDTIADEAGISKRTLYNHFASKDLLVAAYLEGRLKARQRTDEPPRAQILGFFDRLERGVAGPDFRGCPFVNAVAELGTREHPASRVALAAKHDLQRWFHDLLAGSTADADGLDLQLAILVDGAIAAALVRGDPAAVRSARGVAEVLLDSAGL